MKFATVILSSFAALAAAAPTDDLVSQLPSCAKTCLGEESIKAGCAIDDYECQCSKIHDIANNAAPCIQDSCSGDEQEETTSAIVEICLHVKRDVGTDDFHSAAHSFAGAASEAFVGVTGEFGQVFTSATAGAGGVFSTATAVVGGAFSTATAVVGGAFGDGSPANSAPAIADLVNPAVGIVGVAGMFIFAL